MDKVLFNFFWMEIGFFTSDKSVILFDKLDMITGGIATFILSPVILSFHLLLGCYLLWSVTIKKVYWSRVFEREFNINFFFTKQMKPIEALRKVTLILFALAFITPLKLFNIYAMTFRKHLKPRRNWK